MATLYGTSSNDTLIGTTSNDSIYGYAGDDILDGGAGFDTAYYSDASAGISVNLLSGVVTGGAGTDTLSNIEAISGSYYNDTLIGNNSDNTLNGGNWGQDYLSGGDGNDTLSIDSSNTYACFLSGGNGNDSLTGGKGNDEFHGNAGFDTLNGGKGSDTAYYYSAVAGINADLNTGIVTGGDDTDTLISIENISGSWFGDLLVGNSSDNAFYGNHGDDTLTGNAGSDTLDGGSGLDTAIYFNAPASINANLLSGLASGDGGDTLINIENIQGSAYNDTLIGNDSINFLYGNNGNDSLSGGKGTDNLNGGAGDDTLDGGIADYSNAPAGINANLFTGMATGDGTDTLVNISGIQGSAYNDTLVGSGPLYGNSGNDYLSGDYTYDWLFGGVGNDSLSGGKGEDNLYGGAGDDTLDGGSGTDTTNYSTAPAGINADLLTGVVIGEGTDTLINIENIIASNYDDTITGSSGNDSLNGGAGNDVLTGSYGNDSLYGESGTDTLDGGDGDDTYYVNSLTTLVIETNATASGGIDTVYVSTPSYTLPANVENAFINYGKGGNGLIGNSLNNQIHANYYADTIDGGAGLDTISYAGANSSSTLGVTINLALSTAQVTGGSGTDTLLNIENLIGSDYADNLSGNASDNVIDGGPGSDTMAGATGNDTYFVDSTGDVVTEQLNAGIDLVNSSLSTYTLGANIENGRVLDNGANLNGNALANVLYAGKGNNVLDGLAGNDTVSYLYANAAVTVSLASTTAQATGDSGSDTLLNVENLTGSAYNDVLSGNAAANIIDGGLGNDSMAGAAGNDTYHVRQAADVVTELAGQGTDKVISYLANYTLGANVENGQIQAAGAANMTGNALPNLIIAGFGNNVINGGLGLDSVSYAGSKAAVNVSLAIAAAQATGGSGSDTLASIENLIGSNFADKLLGNAGANTLTGGLGRDTLTGNAGNDTFVFNSEKDSGNTLATADVITDFSSGDKINLSGIDANIATSANEAFTSLLAAGGTFTQAGQLKFAAGVLYGNTDADSAAEFVISLTGVTSLTLTDLIL